MKLGIQSSTSRVQERAHRLSGNGTESVQVCLGKYHAVEILPSEEGRNRSTNRPAI